MGVQIFLPLSILGAVMCKPQTLRCLFPQTILLFLGSCLLKTVMLTRLRFLPSPDFFRGLGKSFIFTKMRFIINGACLLALQQITWISRNVNASLAIFKPSHLPSCSGHFLNTADYCCSASHQSLRQQSSREPRQVQPLGSCINFLQANSLQYWQRLCLLLASFPLRVLCKVRVNWLVCKFHKYFFVSPSAMDHQQAFSKDKALSSQAL